VCELILFSSSFVQIRSWIQIFDPDGIGLSGSKQKIILKKFRNVQNGHQFRRLSGPPQAKISPEFWRPHKRSENLRKFRNSGPWRETKKKSKFCVSEQHVAEYRSEKQKQMSIQPVFSNSRKRRDKPQFEVSTNNSEFSLFYSWYCSPS